MPFECLVSFTTSSLTSLFYDGLLTHKRRAQRQTKAATCPIRSESILPTTAILAPSSSSFLLPLPPPPPLPILVLTLRWLDPFYTLPLGAEVSRAHLRLLSDAPAARFSSKILSLMYILERATSLPVATRFVSCSAAFDDVCAVFALLLPVCLPLLSFRPTCWSACR